MQHKGTGEGGAVRDGGDVIYSMSNIMWLRAFDPGSDTKAAFTQARFIAIKTNPVAYCRKMQIVWACVNASVFFCESKKQAGNTLQYVATYLFL